MPKKEPTFELRSRMSHPQIRQSTIQGLLEKVRKNNYHKYLKAVRLHRVRGFFGGQVTFEFPVIGPNGGGKSTILGAAACAYKEIKPSLFFPKSSIGDNSMSEWSMEYETLDRDVNAFGTGKTFECIPAVAMGARRCAFSQPSIFWHQPNGPGR